MFSNREEKWTKKNPSPADHIKTPRAGGVYTHHGIYISDKEVIHFASEDSDNLLGNGNEVINTNLDTFLKGGELLVREYSADEKTKLFDADHIITFARSCVGDDGYNLVVNNCEHFCNKCTMDEHRSQQVNEKLNILKGPKMSFIEKIGNFIEKVNTKKRVIEEPSKVEIAQIEKLKAIQLAEIEKEKILLSSECEAKLNEFNTKLAIQLMKSKNEEFVKLNQKMLEIAQEVQTLEIEKFTLFENASLEVREKIESYYKQAETEIDEYEYDFIEKKLPKLFLILDKYEKDSSIYKSYEKSIETYQISFLERVRTRVAMLKDSQRNLIASSQKTKDLIIDNSNKLIQKRMDMLDKALAMSQQTNMALLEKQRPKLETQMLEENIKEVDLNEIQQIEG
jgi:hypothetical protein